MKLPARVSLCEVGTRDGFQIEPDFIPTEQKIEVVDRLADAGIPTIEVTSFVHPKVVPQMRDAEAVMAGIRRRPGTVYSALVPNDKGAVRAIDAGADEVRTVVSASESHNLANVNMTVEESLARLARGGRGRRPRRRPGGGRRLDVVRLPVRGRGAARADRVAVRAAGRAGGARHRAGRHHRHGQPAPGRPAFAHLMPRWPALEWSLHTHDTRAMAIPNILAAMDAGVTHFDGSIGGLGGCPFAPGASGNVCTEDLVHCLHAMGVETGVALDRLVATARRVQEIVGRTLPGQIVKAGPWDRRYPVPDAVAARLPARG